MNWFYKKHFFQHRYVRIGLSLCFFLWIIFSLAQNTAKISLHIDEIAWFIDTDAFEQLFLKKDIFSSFWQAPQRYDQPPVVKYIYGAYLWTRDKDVFSNRLRLEKEWGRWGIYSNPKTTDIGFEIFGPYIRQMRQVNAIALIGTLLAFYLLLIYVGHTEFWVAMIGTSLLSQNALFLQEMTHATHDGFMLCFMLFSLLFYCSYLKQKSRYWLATAVICAALSAASKLTGVIAFISLCIHQIISILLQEKRKKHTILHFGGITFAFFALWILVNPTLYKNSIQNTFKYFSFRTAQTYQLQAVYPSASLTTLSSKARASWCTLISAECRGFFEKGTVTPVVWINILLLTFGTFYLIVLFYRSKRSAHIGILGIFLFLCIVWNVVLLPMHYGRYYLPTQIGIFFISICGIEGFRLSIYWIVKNKTPVFRRGDFDKTS